MIDPLLRIGSTLSLLLAPVLRVQGRRVRRTVPRLPEADGPRVGRLPGADPPLRLLVLGESTAAGVGAPTHAEALAGQLALAIGTATGRAAWWEVVGRTGATARDARELIGRSRLSFAPDAVLALLGVNDVLLLRSPASWTADLRELAGTLRVHCGPAPLVLAAVPPLHRFPALPQPLRGVLGLRARLLDRAAERLAAQLPAVHHAGGPGLPPGSASVYFASDGFHPSPAGYARWARQLAPAVLRAADTADEADGEPPPP